MRSRRRLFLLLWVVLPCALVFSALRCFALHHNIGKAETLIKAAHIHFILNARHLTLFGKLPEHPFCAIFEHGFGCRIASDKQRIFGEFMAQIIIIEIATGVNHRAASVVLFQHIGKFFHRIRHSLLRHLSGGFHIDKRHQILVFFFHLFGKIIELALHRDVRMKKVVRPHRDARLANFLNVEVIMFGANRDAFGGFDIHEFDIFVARHHFPIDISLIM